LNYESIEAAEEAAVQAQVEHILVHDMCAGPKQPKPRPSSGFYGVHANEKRWLAAICYDNKKAALAYDTAARQCRNDKPLNYESTTAAEEAALQAQAEHILVHDLWAGPQQPKPRPASGFYGVVVSTNGKPWKAKIYYGGKEHHLGTFDTKQEAALVYDRNNAVLNNALVCDTQCDTLCDTQCDKAGEPLNENEYGSIVTASATWNEAVAMLPTQLQHRVAVAVAAIAHRVPHARLVPMHHQVSGSKCSQCRQCCRSIHCLACSDLLPPLCALGSHPPGTPVFSSDRGESARAFLQQLQWGLGAGGGVWRVLGGWSEGAEQSAPVG
jgi:hypothetical protein